MLAVEVDSTERPDIPPFGYEIDYLTFGGIYREVSLRIVPPTFIENIFVRPEAVLTASPALDVDCFIQHSEASNDLAIEAELLDGGRVIEKASLKLPSSVAAPEPVCHSLHLDSLTGIKLWDLQNRNLYSVRVHLRRKTQLLDEDSRPASASAMHVSPARLHAEREQIKLRGLEPASDVSRGSAGHARARAASRCADSCAI